MEESTSMMFSTRQKFEQAFRKWSRKTNAAEVASNVASFIEANPEWVKEFTAFKVLEIMGETKEAVKTLFSCMEASQCREVYISSKHYRYEITITPDQQKKLNEALDKIRTFLGK